jgi:hypothetical protein
VIKAQIELEETDPIPNSLGGRGYLVDEEVD